MPFLAKLLAGAIAGAGLEASIEEWFFRKATKSIIEQHPILTGAVILAVAKILLSDIKNGGTKHAKRDYRGI